jgi:hypothetical protein
MIKNVASWDRCYCEVAKIINDKYSRVSILDSLGLQCYLVGINHQKEYLNQDDLDIFRNFVLRSDSLSVCYDKNFSYLDEIENFKWTKIKNRILTNNNYAKKFNEHLYNIWSEYDKSKFIDESLVTKLEGKTRKLIVKNMINSFSSFSYSKELSKFGNMVFTSPVTEDFALALFVDTPNLKTAAGMPSNVPASLELGIALYEYLPDKNFIRHFIIDFTKLYPLSEGIAFRSYKMIKSDSDLIALLGFYFSLYKKIESDFIQAVERDIKKIKRARLNASKLSPK